MSISDSKSGLISINPLKIHRGMYLRV
jgi:hypothetical protein